MKQASLQKVYIDELRDLYSAETQLLKALPKMAKASSSAELRTAFEEHLEQTKGHVTRLETIFESLDESPKGKRCLGMEGLVKEGEETIGEDFDEQALDAAVIGAAQRVEHYEIAAYGTARSHAQLLEEATAAGLLEETLQEEKEADNRLTEIAEQINADAAGGDEGPASDRRKPKTRAARA